jgi:hypothetical protein
MDGSIDSRGGTLVVTHFSSFTRPAHRFSIDGMGRSFVAIGCLALMAALTSAAKADPVMGSVSLTIAQDAGLSGYGAGIAQGPVVYSSGTVDLSQLFQSQMQPGGVVTYQGLNLNGPVLLPGAGGLLDLNFNTAFQMKITFDGASGSMPAIDVTGSLKGNAYGEPNGTSAGNLGITAYATPLSATLQGWTPASGIPMSLINQYLNPSNYYLTQQMGYQYSLTQGAPATASFSLAANSFAITPVPEPGTVLAYLTVLAGLGLQQGARFLRSRSAR